MPAKQGRDDSGGVRDSGERKGVPPSPEDSLRQVRVLQEEPVERGRISYPQDSSNQVRFVGGLILFIPTGRLRGLLRGSPRAIGGKPGQRREREFSALLRTSSLSVEKLDRGGFVGSNPTPRTEKPKANVALNSSKQ